MNKKRRSDRDKKKARFMFSSAHVIIAIVAIIECLILISFTTYSWIETASSLIIWNGKQSIVQTDPYTKMDIVDNLNYRFQVKGSTASTSNAADLNDFFRSVKFYQFAKTSSANGKDFFFKRPSGSYRAGDTTDYNTSYIYFDFNVLNYGYSPLKKLKFYFADNDIFSVTGPDATKCQTVTNAMRISFQTGNGSPKIYAETATQTTARSSTSGTTAYTPTAIESNQNLKVFTVAKHNSNSEGTNVSCRIWLESEAAGMSGITAADLAAMNININLRLTYAENETDFLYFDDYTYSYKAENMGGHLTADDPESTYRMYFVYNNSTVYPMTQASSQTNPDALTWVTCDSTGNENATVPNTTANPYIDNLCTSGSTAVTNSYFAYGTCALNQSTVPTSPLYKWYLNSESNDDTEHRFNAYSVVKTKISAAASVVKYGAGGWNYNTPLTQVYFRDRATGLTSGAYNDGSNFQYITDAVNISESNPNDVIYLNNITSNIATDTTTMKTQASATAVLYYDPNADNRQGMFKGWVPTSWISSTNKRFRYCPGGAYCSANEEIRWTPGAATLATNSSDYIYTALGYDSMFMPSYYDGTNASYATGSGTWNAVLSTPIYFSTELIDNYATSAHRYQIGVKIGSSSSFVYYHLAPVTDGAYQKFYAYLPDPNNGNTNGTSDYAAAKICFRNYDKYSTDTGTNAATLISYWLANARNAGSTFYPVKTGETGTGTDYTRGYWHISVIVDGTYEHLFWDTGDPLDTTDDGVLGHFYYNTSGHSDPFNASNYTEITPYQLDEYRWYVPLDSNPTATFIYYRWLPYDDVDLKFNHNTANGIYCIVTEASDGTSGGAGSSGGVPEEFRQPPTSAPTAPKSESVTQAPAATERPTSPAATSAPAAVSDDPEQTEGYDDESYDPEDTYYDETDYDDESWYE